MATHLNNGPGDGELERICQSLADVIQILPSPLRRVRVQLGSSSIEVEWQKPPPITSSTTAAVTSSHLETLPAIKDPYPVCASLVGTFYRAPQPGARPFVELGDEVQPGQQVAVIEAMKLTHPVNVDIVGRVVAILVADGEPVEYGQQLVHLEPLDKK